MQAVLLRGAFLSNLAANHAAQSGPTQGRAGVAANQITGHTADNGTGGGILLLAREIGTGA